MRHLSDNWLTDCHEPGEQEKMSVQLARESQEALNICSFTHVQVPKILFQEAPQLDHDVEMVAAAGWIRV